MSAEKLDSHTALDARGDIWRRIDEGTLDLLYLSPEGLMQPLMLERLPLALVATALVSFSHESYRAAVYEPHHRPVPLDCGERLNMGGQDLRSHGPKVDGDDGDDQVCR